MSAFGPNVRTDVIWTYTAKIGPARPTNCPASESDADDSAGRSAVAFERAGQPGRPPVPDDTYLLRLTPIDGSGPARDPGWPNLSLAAGFASAPPALSVPLPRPGQRPRHSHRQYPIAPGSVGAPSASSVPHRASVSGCAIRVVSIPSRQGQWRAIRVSTPGRPAVSFVAGGRRAQLVPPTWTHCRPSHIQHERTDERARTGRLERTGPLAAGTGRGPLARGSLGRRAGGDPRSAGPDPRLGRTSSIASPARPVRTRPGPMPLSLGALEPANEACVAHDCARMAARAFACEAARAASARM